MFWMRSLLLLLLAAGLPGCAIVQVSVRNPVVGLEKVAIAPFFNLCSERAVDGHEFAEAYFTELQKVPGFEVVPVGIVDRAIRENQLTLEGPEDALRLAKLLDVDAVVVGAVTDFDPYVPRVGLKVSWYSNREWEFLPTVPETEQSSKARRRAFLPETVSLGGNGSTQSRSAVKVVRSNQPSAVMRAQSPNGKAHPELRQLFDAVPEGNWQTAERQVVESESKTRIAADDDFMPPRTAVTSASAIQKSSLRDELQRATQSAPLPMPAAPAPRHEFVYEVAPGPLFGEPRISPDSSHAPVATVIEEAEFIGFPNGEIVISEPVPVAPHVVFMPDTEGNLIPVTFEPQEVVVTQPLPLPPPPSPLVPEISATTKSAPQPMTASSKLALDVDPDSDKIVPLPLPVPEVLQPRKPRPLMVEATQASEAAQAAQLPDDPIPNPALPNTARKAATANEPAPERRSNSQRPKAAIADSSAAVPNGVKPHVEQAQLASNAAGTVSLGQRAFDPQQPLMSYVRMFDATDANLVARLSDYLELSGETRTGDVSAFMRRTDFFQKFTAHVMISEMLSLHGGEARRRWVLKSRQYR